MKSFFGIEKLRAASSRRAWPVLLLLFFLTTARGAESFSSVYLSEMLVENRRGLRDEDGERSGWIELFNGGNTPVNLAGWWLTDSSTQLARWRLPGAVLLPGHYLVVFASGKDRGKDLVHLHTNFKLSPGGGFVGLVNAKTNLISQFAAYPKPGPDISFGRVRGEPSLQGSFSLPSPGGPNMAGGAGFAPEISFSRPSGNFTESFSLVLTTIDQDALIHYTLDGSMPLSGSPVYAGPLTITNTAHIRARAFRAGVLPGPPASAAYLRLFTNVIQFSSNLPILVMDTFGKDVPVSAQASFVRFSVHEPVNGRASLTNPPTFTTRGGYRVRGSSSGGMPQSSFAIHFLDEFDQERHHPFLGLPAESEWVLYAPNGYDPVLLHNPFVHQLSREMGRYSSRTRFVEVFVAKTAGRIRELHYNGLYVLEEKIKVGRHRIDIDHLLPEDTRAPEVTGGYLLKFDRVGPGEGGAPIVGPTAAYVDPKEQTLSLPQRSAQREYLTQYFRELDEVFNGPNWKDPTRGYRAYIDVNAAIDFHVLEVLSGNVDAMVLSTYFYKPRNGRITFGPHWDFDRALGSTDGRDDNPRQWTTGPFFDGAWWPKLFRDPDFWQLWVDRWQELRRTQFALSRIDRLIDQLAAELSEAQPREYRRWGFQPRGGSYQSEIDHMKDWISNRVDFIDRQLVAVPVLSHSGGTVAPGFNLTLSAGENATIYYTLDGTDPRAPQGGVSSNAVAYSGPVPIKSAGKLVARANDPKQRQRGGPPVSTPWSGPVRADFVLKPEH